MLFVRLERAGNGKKARAVEVRRPTSQNVESVPQVERRAQQITDPVERLRYLRKAMEGVPAALVPVSVVMPVAAPARSLSLPELARRWTLRHSQFTVAVITLICLLGVAIRLIRTKTTAAETRHSAVSATIASRSAGKPSLYAETPAPKVWPVEQRDEYEIFSNGLRIENAYRTQTQPRRYLRFRLGGTDAGQSAAERSTAPAGLVYHTTEGQLAPFVAEQTRRLIQLGANLLGYIRKEQSYHFVIDRFGRVFRVVQEGDVAYHAGQSVWADRQWGYVGLNHSFLGVAFESRTDPQEPLATVAQLRAGRMLTEMLRSRYSIPARNCVTHAQVSVNNSNMLIGTHTDWAGNFPFSELGLPSNYDLPLPSLYTFGFGYDSFFVKATGNKPWRGLQEAEEQVRRDATQKGLIETKYRDLLRERYKKLLQTVKNGDAGEEKGDDRSE